MQSYGKLTVNDGKDMGERRLPLPCDDGDGSLAQEALSRGSTRSEIAYFSGWKKILYFMTRVQVAPNF